MAYLPQFRLWSTTFFMLCDDSKQYQNFPETLANLVKFIVTERPPMAFLGPGLGISAYFGSLTRTPNENGRL